MKALEAAIGQPPLAGRNNNTWRCPCGFKANLSKKWAEQITGITKCPVCQSKRAYVVRKN